MQHEITIEIDEWEIIQERFPNLPEDAKAAAHRLRELSSEPSDLLLASALLSVAAGVE